MVIFIQYKDLIFNIDKEISLEHKINFKQLNENNIKLIYRILGSKNLQESKINLFSKLEKINIKIPYHI